MLLEARGSKVEIAPPVHESLKGKLWDRMDRLPAYLPDNVNEVQWMTAAAAASNSWYQAAAKMAQAKGVQVDLNSLVKSVFSASVVGLPLVDQLGLAHLVPMHLGKNRRDGGAIECNLIIGYKGFIELARSANVIDVITPEIVWGNEVFERWNDESGAHFRHEPSLERPDIVDVKDIRAAYVVSKTPTGHADFELVTGSTIRSLANRQRNVWKTNPVEMAKKTPIRRIAKRWPQTNRLAAAVRLDEQLDADERQSSLVSLETFDTAAIESAKTTPPEWLGELQSALGKAETPEALQSVVEQFRDRHGDSEALQRVCEGYRKAAGFPDEPVESAPVVVDSKEPSQTELFDGPGNHSEAESAPEKTKDEIIAECQKRFEKCASLMGLRRSMNRAIKEHPACKTAITLAAAVVEREKFSESPVEANGLLERLSQDLEACTTPEEVEACADKYLSEAPADAELMEKIYDARDKREDTLAV